MTDIRHSFCRRTPDGNATEGGTVQTVSSRYGGAPTPAIEWVSHGVRSVMRAGAVFPSMVSETVVERFRATSGRVSKTVPCQWYRPSIGSR
jgi:hypothetical protein